MTTDANKVYDDQISPLMTQIIEICIAHKIPLFANFRLGADPELNGDQLLCSTILFGGDREQLVMRILGGGPSEEERAVNEAAFPELYARARAVGKENH